MLLVILTNICFLARQGPPFRGSLSYYFFEHWIYLNFQLGWAKKLTNIWVMFSKWMDADYGWWNTQNIFRPLQLQRLILWRSVKHVWDKKWCSCKTAYWGKACHFSHCYGMPWIWLLDMPWSSLQYVLML